MLELSKLELRKQIILISVILFLLFVIISLFLYMLPSIIQTALSSVLLYGTLLIALLYLVKLIKKKDYWFSTLILLFALLQIFQIADGALDVINTADAQEIVDLIRNFYYLTFLIACFTYGIQLIRKKDYRFGIPFLIMFLAAAILLVLTMFLSFIFQGLK